MGPGDFILVASRPGMGKTSIGLNIALSAAKSTGKTVAVFSLEMTREQLVMRLLAGEGLVDSKKLQTGRLSDDEWRRVGTAAGALSATDIRIDDNPSLTVSEMNAQCRRLKNLGLIVIMAKELGVPVLCLSQLSRANESRQNKRPMLSDLRESGAIEQDADVVMGIYREGYYNQECENPNDAELIILKNRRGQTGTINLMWLPEYTSFVAVDRRHDDD
jgi:replicative DNA helicase